MTMGFQQGGSTPRPARKSTSRVEDLGVQDLVDNLLEANACYEEIQKAVQEQTGETVSISALSRWRGRWASARRRMEETQKEVETIMGVLDAKPGTNFKDAAMGLLWTKMIRRMAEADASFDTTDMLELGHLLVKANRASQIDQALSIQRDRLELLKERVKGVADKVEETVKAKGLDPETIKTIREEIYGLAPEQAA